MIESTSEWRRPCHAEPVEPIAHPESWVCDTCEVESLGVDNEDWVMTVFGALCPECADNN